MSEVLSSTPATYAGEATPKEAWDRLAQDPTARLVDVRTQPEWMFVGVPDLSELARQPILVSWQIFPGMNRNAAFVRQLDSQGVGRDDPIYLLCRSGARSLAAAEFLTAEGYRFCYNVTHGFEGPLDERRHRGAVGWKASGLPWVQG